MKAQSYKLAAWGALLLLGACPLLYAQSNTEGGAATPAPVTADVSNTATPVAPTEPATATPAVPVESPSAAPVATGVESPSTMEVPTQPAEEGISVGGDNNTISIQLDSVPVSDVVRMFARAANANIVAGPLPATNITAHLDNVQWEAALTAILNSVGLALVQPTNGIYAVVGKNEVGIEPIDSDIIFLNYSTSSNVLPMVQRMVAGITNAAVSDYSGANAIVIRAPRSNLIQIKDVISRLDKPRDQVMIECKFVELNDQAIKDLGINWQSMAGWTVGLQAPQIALNNTSTRRNSINKNFTSEELLQNARVNVNDRQSARGSSRQDDSATSAAVGIAPPTPATAAAVGSSSDSSFSSSGSSSERISISGNNFSAFDAAQGTVTLVPTADNITENIDFGQKEAINALSAVLTADAFQATLSALQQNDGVQVVSNPKIVVASGQTALIHVGRNEPNIVAVPQGDTGDRYAYQLDAAKPFIEIGVKLYVTPVLNTSNNISLKIAPELSRKLADKLIGEAGTTFPITEIRRVETEFSIESGRTVALGGLTETRDQESVKKIPILGDIPIIGTLLFRHTHKEKVQDEVIIFVTASSAAAHSLAQVSGIPEDAQLIHRHLAKKVEEAARAEDLARKKAQKAALPK